MSLDPLLLCPRMDGQNWRMQATLDAPEFDTSLHHHHFAILPAGEGGLERSPDECLRHAHESCVLNFMSTYRFLYVVCPLNKLEEPTTVVVVHVYLDQVCGSDRCISKFLVYITLLL